MIFMVAAIVFGHFPALLMPRTSCLCANCRLGAMVSMELNWGEMFFHARHMKLRNLLRATMLTF